MYIYIYICAPTPTPTPTPIHTHTHTHTHKFIATPKAATPRHSSARGNTDCCTGAGGFVRRDLRRLPVHARRTAALPSCPQLPHINMLATQETPQHTHPRPSNTLIAAQEDLCDGLCAGRSACASLRSAHRFSTPQKGGKSNFSRRRHGLVKETCTRGERLQLHSPGVA